MLPPPTPSTPLPGHRRRERNDAAKSHMLCSLPPSMHVHELRGILGRKSKEEDEVFSVLFSRHDGKRPRKRAPNNAKIPTAAAVPPNQQTQHEIASHPFLFFLLSEKLQLPWVTLHFRFVSSVSFSFFLFFLNTGSGRKNRFLSPPSWFI